MRGHVRKRGSKWAFVVELGHDPETGKRRQRWHSGYERKLDAERALTEALAKLAAGGYVEPSKLTVARFVDNDWLPAIRATIAPTTFESYRRNLRVHVVPALGGTRLQRLTPAQLNTLYGELLDPLKPSTVRQVHAAVRRMLIDAVRWGHVTRNVADLADPPRATSHAMQTWTADELAGFLASVHGHRLYPLFHVLATTGMRRGEVVGARWDDLELDAARWAVRRSLVPTERGVVESAPKTARGQRSVALDPGTVRVLRAWRKSQLEERLAWGPAWTDIGRVFTREDGRDLTPRYVSDTFAALVKRSGLPRLTVHGLRHTHATLALAAGVHPKVVQERLGHASVKITLDTYSHVIPAMQEDAAAAVARLVGLD